MCYLPLNAISCCLQRKKGTPAALSVAFAVSEMASTSDLSVVGTKFAAKASRPGGLAPFGTFDACI